MPQQTERVDQILMRCELPVDAQLARQIGQRTVALCAGEEPYIDTLLGRPYNRTRQCTWGVGTAALVLRHYSEEDPRDPSKEISGPALLIATHAQTDENGPVPYAAYLYRPRAFTTMRGSTISARLAVVSGLVDPSQPPDIEHDLEVQVVMGDAAPTEQDFIDLRDLLLTAPSS